MDVLIVPCTAEKIWDSEPSAGAVPARDAYTRSDFKTWRSHAERSGYPWYILSTRYGLLSPDQPIDRYNVPIGRAQQDPALHALLRKQGQELQLDSFDHVVLIDWRRFEPLVRAALDDQSKFQLRRVLYND